MHCMGFIDIPSAYWPRKNLQSKLKVHKACVQPVKRKRIKICNKVQLQKPLFDYYEIFVMKIIILAYLYAFIMS